jgi:hypothetical protein
MLPFEDATTQPTAATEALAALRALADATGQIAALARHLNALADAAEATIDVLAPAVGCAVADVYELGA